MRAQQPRSQRRAVLSTLAAGSAAAVVAVAGRLGAKGPAISAATTSLPDEPRAKEPASTGYRETAHVRKYYRTAA